MANRPLIPWEKMTWEQQQEWVKEEKAQFPEVFGLRKFDGRFRVGEGSYVQTFTTGKMVVQLVIDRLVDGKWVSFSKAQPHELRAEMKEGQ